MKSAISPDIWETKRMLITKLYKDEEWPLKQVIKLVQTRDFHPSESQLRSRLKKWHITKPSRKKYDGSRRLSGAKKNEHKRPSDASLPSSATYNTLPSQSIPRIAEESDACSETRSETSRPSVSISTSPADHYVLPSSPARDDRHSIMTSPIYGQNPVTPITPAFYGMQDPKRAPNDQAHIYFCPPEFNQSEFSVTNPGPAYSHGQFGFPDPNQFHPQADYTGYNGVPYMSTHSYPQHKNPGDGPFMMPDLPPPLVDGSWGQFPCQPSPTDIYPHPSYFQDECIQPLAPPIYQAM
ncbi:hypothetical protein BJX99DRAFT_239691 [Aspergillus californicus]